MPSLFPDFLGFLVINRALLSISILLGGSGNVTSSPVSILATIVAFLSISLSRPLREILEGMEEDPVEVPTECNKYLLSVRRIYSI